MTETTRVPFVRLFLLALVLGLLALLALATAASAASATDGSCANTRTSLEASQPRAFIVGVGSISHSPDSCTVTGQPLAEVEAGASYVVRCVEIPNDPITPRPPDAQGIRVRGYADADNFQTGGAGTPIWETRFDSCTPEQTVTRYCTSDGTATGAPRYGTVRLFVRAIRTGTFPYDVNSEDAQASSHWGVLRCLARAATFTDPAQPVLYVGGDTFTARLALTASPYNAGTTGQLAATCAASTVTLGNAAFGTTETDISTTIKGDLSTWPDDCTLGQRASLTRLSAVPGFTAKPYARWWGTQPPGLTVSPDGLTLSRSTGKTLDRDLTGSACAARIAGAVVPVLHRAEPATLEGTWTNGRGEPVTSGRLADAYPYRIGTTPEDESDFIHIPGTFAASGFLAVTAQSTPTATTTAETPAPDYATHVRTYGASRTTGELHNLGACPAFVDVSASWSFAGLTLSKNAAPLVNASNFVIGEDRLFLRAEGLTNARGAALSGKAVTCQRTLPDATNEAPASMGTTDADGTTPVREFGIIAPAGTWVARCDASENGNAASFAVAYLHASPLTAQTSLGIVTSPAPGGFTVNVSAVFRAYAPACDCPDRAFPDAGGAVRLTVLFYNATAGTWDAWASRLPMNQTSPQESAFFVVVDVHDLDAERPVLLIVSANVTGRAFLSSSSYASLASFSVQSHEPTVIESTWPFFAIMGLGLAFIAATLHFRVPMLSCFTLAACFAGFVLYQEAQAQGVSVLAGPFVPVLLLMEGLASLGAAAYAMRR